MIRRCICALCYRIVGDDVGHDAVKRGLLLALRISKGACRQLVPLAAWVERILLAEAGKEGGWLVGRLVGAWARGRVGARGWRRDVGLTRLSLLLQSTKRACRL